MATIVACDYHGEWPFTPAIVSVTSHSKREEHRIRKDACFPHLKEAFFDVWGDAYGSPGFLEVRVTPLP